MKKLRLLFSALVISTGLFFQSCDKVDQPYYDTPVCPAVTFPDTNGTTRNILFEEFTGHTCGNCPSGAYDLRTIWKPLYNDRLIIVSVHAGVFATPDIPAGYYADYRTEASIEYDAFFGVTGYPSGMVNRVPYASQYVVGKVNWGNAFALEAAKPLEIDLQMYVEYNESADPYSVCLHMHSKFLTAKNGRFNVVGYFVEDSIISKQKNYPGAQGDPDYQVPRDPNYVHRHMLRDNIGGTWGVNMWSGNAPVGKDTTVSLKYNFQPRDTVDFSHRKHHYYFVGYVYDFDTKEIHQVIEKKLTPY
ncbi:MAG: Omp28-related outer membrane protein [Flavobacteriales bacterium]